MYEHPSYIYSTIMVEQERVDRANELRRVIAEQPSRIVKRERPVITWLRGLLGRRSAAPAGPCMPREAAARPAHAR